MLDKNMREIISIITPVYNRAENLKDCYISLSRQTDKNFEWIIVDDGSIDNIRQVVYDLIEQKTLEINFLQKENGGKHTAVNFAIDNLSPYSKLVIILDSDDFLTDDAVEVIRKYDQKYRYLKDICGYTFLKQKITGEVWGNRFKGDWISDYIESRINLKTSHGEKCDVFYTSVIKNYKFTEYSNEKYIGESTIAIKMAEKYRIVCSNEVIYMGQYLEGGLTNSGRMLRIQAPLGGMEYAYLRMSPKCNLKERIRAAILFNAYRRISIIRLKYENSAYSKYRYLRLATYLVGDFLGWYWIYLSRKEK